MISTRFILISTCSLFFLLGLNIIFKGGEPIWQIYYTDANVFQLILKLRVNAVLTALVCGSGLAICGLFLQTLFQNPLSSPYTLGVSSVSSLFISSFILLGSFLPSWIFQSDWILVLLQFMSSLAGACVSLWLISKIQSRSQSNSMLILIGILVGTFASSLSQILEYFMSGEQLKTNFLWNLGSFEVIEFKWICCLIIGVSLLIFLFYRLIHSSNLFLLGSIYARNAGLDIHNYQRNIFALSAVLIALITVFCGPIGFIGLISPHIAKMLLKTQDHKLIFFPSLLTGAIFGLVCLFISQANLFDLTIPINTVAALIGVPFTIYLMLKYFKQ